MGEKTLYSNYNYQKKKKIIVLICIVSLFGCRSLKMPTPNYDKSEIKLPIADYLVKEIIKEKNDLYIIDLERSDTVFRIFSHYDGEKNANDVEIHINDSVRVELIEPSEMERNLLWDNPSFYVEIDMEIYGVFISKYLRDSNYKV